MINIIIAALIVTGFLVGLRLMQSPKTALLGNRLGAFCMGLALLFTLNETGLLQSFEVWAFILLGGVLGLILGQKVKMIQMPQTVALLNGFGGAASALVAGSAVIIYTGTSGWFFGFTAAIALAIGSLTFIGSLVAALKLQGSISQQPVVIKNHGLLLNILLITGFLFIISFTIDAGNTSISLLSLVVIFLLYGFLMAIKVGGADMPVIISFLNSFSGIAASVCGLAVGNLLLTGAGALVGVAGMILTQIMCRAMNRNLASVLSGVKRDLKITKEETAANVDKEVVDNKLTPQERISEVIKNTQNVIIVPGYGMALGQAQKAVKDLIDILESKGIEVKIAVHPVAGRMPGHMHVLLAEVGVPYEKLYDLEDINPEFSKTDLVVIVGACDVVNPAANTAEDTPIYGMPILEVNKAASVIVCNYDEKPGYSGVDNSLYNEHHIIPLWGDAAKSVPEIVKIIKGKEDAGEGALKENSFEKDMSEILRNAQKVIIVPGYGMALGQAQQAVKDLIDTLESKGKEVKIAVHPVAGRMPGHMHVLLAEVGVPYEKLYDLEDINPEFSKTDLVVIVGACDVVNPAANTAEDTPIYGMPILEVNKAASVIVCNYDEKPGYSGVDNSLYNEDHIIPLWGDAAKTVPLITEKLL